ncbi:MAG: hypothetical protein IPM92_02100 [Saprospiraceae bacterium]|nr:hypothetical protein [Saprospiraceae bacterium]
MLANEKIKYKTIRYTADHVHDFAWFADKNFLVQKSQVDLGDDHKVDTWTFFKNPEIWKESITYVNRSIGFYSSHIGAYPWPQAAAVESELNAGGGMEYPMITVIGTMYNHEQLDEVIAHEIAHNWFYGVIAFNERDHPFLDEGITSYYEQRYMRKYYEEEDWFSDEGILARLFRNVDAEKFQYLLLARPHLDQYPNQNADRFTSINYGNDVYIKTAALFSYIEKYIGQEKLDSLLRSFYEKWKFKHPYPEDLEDHFRQNETKDFTWFFKGFISSDRKMDYRMKSLQKENDSISIKIENCNGIEAPFLLSAIKNDEKMESKWIDGFKGSKILKSSCRDCDYFAIDIDQESLDLYENNNYIQAKSAFNKIEKINLRLWPLIDKPRSTDIGITPVINFNNYDGISTGLYISSALLPFRKFKMHVMPFYGFRSKEISGSAGLSYHWFRPDTRIHHWKFDIDFKKYAYAKNKDASFLNYYQLKPSVTCVFYHLPSSQVKSQIRYTIFAEKNEYVDYSDTTTPGFSQEHLNTYTHVIDYSRSKTSILGNTSLDIRLIYFNQKMISPLQQNFLRTDISLQKSFLIAKNRYANIRSYVSFFPINSERHSTSISSRTSPYYFRGSTGLTFQNYQDELNEYYFKGRTEISGFASQQLYLKQGAFKLPLGYSYRENIGNSNSLAAALNLSTDLPIPKIGNYLKPYFDLGYYQTKPVSPDGNWIWSGGIELELIPDILSFYFPMAHSTNIRNLLKAKTENNYWKQISFTLNIHISETELLQKILRF